jgi:organic radical activating enzyme
VKHFKYLVTTKCPYGCDYCINQYLDFTVTQTFTNTLDVVKHMWNNRFTHMSLTGGEPTTCMARTNAVAAIDLYELGYQGLTLMESWPYHPRTKLEPLLVSQPNFSLRFLQCADVAYPFPVVCHTNIGKIEVGTGFLQEAKE